MTITEQAILILALIVLIFSGGWMARGWKDGDAQKNELAKLAEQIQAKEQAQQQQATTYETQRFIAQQTISNLNQKLEAYRVKEPIPTDCFIPPSGMSTLASAVAAANSGRSGPKLPAAAKPK